MILNETFYFIKKIHGLLDVNPTVVVVVENFPLFVKIYSDVLDLGQQRVQRVELELFLSFNIIMGSEIWSNFGATRDSIGKSIGFSAPSS